MYILVKIQTASDGTVISASYTYATLNEALSAYYAELSAGVVSTALKEDTCLILDAQGGTLRVDTVQPTQADADTATA